MSRSVKSTVPAENNVTTLASARSRSARSRSPSPAHYAEIAGVRYMRIPFREVVKRLKGRVWCSSQADRALGILGSNPILAEDTINTAIVTWGVPRAAQAFREMGHTELAHLLDKISNHYWQSGANYWPPEKRNRVATAAVLAYSMEYAKD